MSKILLLGKALHHCKEKEFGIKTDDRRRHIYIIGKTGMGKTSLLENMAVQDIQEGRGVGIIDPHGEFAEKMLKFVPKNRINDVVYFNPVDIDFPVSFNVMERTDYVSRHLVAAGLLGVFKKIWPDAWSARMEYILNNTILALLEIPGTTLLGINRMLSDKEYRSKVVERITDPSIRSFWLNEFARYPQNFREEAIAPIQNKVGQFISTPTIRNIVGQVKSKIDMRRVMDEGKILILNLSKGKIGEDPSRLLGALAVTKIYLAAMSRVELPEEKRNDFFLYVDEFQNFATEAFASILSEARKYRLSLVLAHQYINQLEEITASGLSTKVKDAVFGNVGTIITFRVGAEDAEFLENEFMPEFSLNDLVNLPKYYVYIRLMIDGLSSRPFSAITLSPPGTPKTNYEQMIIKISRERYGTKKEAIEEKIARWSGMEETKKIIEKEKKERPIYLKELKKKTPVTLTKTGQKKPDVEAVKKAIEEALKKT